MRSRNVTEVEINAKLPLLMAGFKRRQPPSLIWVHNKAGAERRVYSYVWQENKHSHMLTFRLCVHDMLLYSATIFPYKIHEKNKLWTNIWTFFLLSSSDTCSTSNKKGLPWTIMTEQIYRQCKTKDLFKKIDNVFEGHWFSHTLCTAHQMIKIIQRVSCVNKYLRYCPPQSNLLLASMSVLLYLFPIFCICILRDVKLASKSVTSSTCV